MVAHTRTQVPTCVCDVTVAAIGFHHADRRVLWRVKASRWVVVQPRPIERERADRIHDLTERNPRLQLNAPLGGTQDGTITNCAWGFGLSGRTVFVAPIARTATVANMTRPRPS